MTHGELRRLLRQIVRHDLPEDTTSVHVAIEATRPTQGQQGLRSKGWSRPAAADHAELAAFEAGERQAARECRRHGGPSHALRLTDRFVDGMEVLRDGTELHLASLQTCSAAHHPGCHRSAAWSL